MKPPLTRLHFPAGQRDSLITLYPPPPIAEPPYSTPIGGAPRFVVTIVLGQVVYDPPTGSLICFTGGMAAAYYVQQRGLTDLRPAQSPPPVLAGSLAYDPLPDEIVLFGGGHVAERGKDGG